MNIYMMCGSNKKYMIYKRKLNIIGIIGIIINWFNVNKYVY